MLVLHSEESLQKIKDDTLETFQRVAQEAAQEAINFYLRIVTAFHKDNLLALEAPEKIIISDEGNKILIRMTIENFNRMLPSQTAQAINQAQNFDIEELSMEKLKPQLFAALATATRQQKSPAFITSGPQRS